MENKNDLKHKKNIYVGLGNTTDTGMKREKTLLEVCDKQPIKINQE